MSAPTKGFMRSHLPPLRILDAVPHETGTRVHNIKRNKINCRGIPAMNCFQQKSLEEDKRNCHGAEIKP